MTRGVKNLLSGARQAPVAAALESLVEGKQVCGPREPGGAMGGGGVEQRGGGRGAGGRWAAARTCGAGWGPLTRP
jgi:hypothetical protein